MRAVIGAPVVVGVVVVDRTRVLPRASNDPTGFIGRDSRSDNDSVSNARGARRWATNNGNGMTNGMTNRTASTKDRRVLKRGRARVKRGSRTTAPRGGWKGRIRLTAERRARGRGRNEGVLQECACAMTGSSIVFIAAAILPRDSRISSSRPRGPPPFPLVSLLRTSCI